MANEKHFILFNYLHVTIPEFFTLSSVKVTRRIEMFVMVRLWYSIRILYVNNNIEMGLNPKKSHHKTKLFNEGMVRFSARTK